MGENAGVKMATSPASDAYHPSNNNHNDIDNHVAINLSTSPKQPPATQLLQPKSHSPTNQPDAAPTDKPIANPLDGVGIQNVAESFATERTNDHHESSIKLKRCKHGRIKVKDLSKKRLGQNSDNEATTAQNSKNESNNNHIASSIKINDDIINKDIIKTDNASSNDLSNDRLSGPSIEATRPPRSRSGTPLRKTAKHESPTRKSRFSRSPSRDRSSSRERSRSSRHRRDSPRRRSGIQSRRSRRKTKRSRTPERDSYSNSYRYHRRSRSRTSSRRSRSPSHQEMNHRHRRRIISRSPSRERINRDRCSKELNLSNNKEDIFDKLSHRKSPKDRESETATLDTRKVDRSAISQNQHGNHTSKPELSSQSSSKPTISAPQRTLHPTLGPNFLPKLAQADPDPRDNLSTRSPTTPSKGDSAASDIYDPEEPILPISPVESPPIVERGGDDDVPSSAVQLNQQEKYLQKFHRQERVVEEVKIALRPFYQNRTINKEQYKDVLRKAVPKICHSKDGEINPVKIRFLVDAYVKKMG